MRWIGHRRKIAAEPTSMEQVKLRLGSRTSQEGLRLDIRALYKTHQMSGESDREQTMVCRERRLLVLRRQAVRGQRHVIGRLTRLEREFRSWHRQLQVRRA